jgi:hypothetical protein
VPIGVGPPRRFTFGSLDLATLRRLADDPRLREVSFRFHDAIGVGDIACERLFPVSEHLVSVRPGVHRLFVAIHREGA